MRTIMIISIFSLLLLGKTAAQNTLPPEPKPVKQFGSLKLINLQTTKDLPKKSFIFNIQHRFGKTQLSEDFFKDFMGLDLTSNIRFAFSFPLTKSLYIGAGRTKFGKNYDASANYNFLRQTTDNSTPVSLSLFASASFMSDDFPSVANDWTFEDGSQFEYTPLHRMAYYVQASVSRKITPWLVLEVAPVFTHANLVDEGYNNSYYALPIGGKIKTGFKSSIIFEQHFILNKTANQIHPFSFGYEIGTAGHGFQILVSSSNQLLGQEIYYNENFKLLDGTFYLGFNIFRTFYIKR